MQTSQLNREELETKALESVCPCYFYELRNDVQLIDSADLEAIVADGMICHHENQKHNPVSEEEFQEELRQCPSWSEV